MISVLAGAKPRPWEQSHMIGRFKSLAKTPKNTLRATWYNFAVDFVNWKASPTGISITKIRRERLFLNCGVPKKRKKMGRRTKTDGKKDLNTNRRKVQLKYKNIDGGWPILSCNSFLFLFFILTYVFLYFLSVQTLFFRLVIAQTTPPPPPPPPQKIKWPIP